MKKLNNKKNIVLIGGGGHASVLLNILERLDDFAVLGYADVKKTNLKSKYLGRDSELDESITNNLIISLSYGSNIYSGLREKVIHDLSNRKFNFPKVISNLAIIGSNVKIFEGTQILDNAIINSDTFIGKFNIINTGVIIEHNVKICDFTQIAPGAIILGDVAIGNNCFVGSGVIINDGVKICDDVIIGSGGVVIENLDVPGTYVGNPVRKVK